MPAASLDLGPLRASGPVVSGLIDVHFDGEQLVLRRYGWGLELLDRYRLQLVALMILLVLLGIYADDGLATALLLAAGIVLAALVVLVLTELVLTVTVVGTGLVMPFTRSGRRALVDRFRGVRAQHSGTATVVPEPDITLMDNVYGAWRPRLLLQTDVGELRLSGWFWRRRQLEKLQAALGR